MLQKVRDENASEEWILFMLKGIEFTAIETINLVEGFKNLMTQFKKDIRDNLPKIYSQYLLNNLFRYPYTRIEFVMKELSISRPTASSYLKQIETRGLVVKFKFGRENFYLNEKLFDLLINAFHLEWEFVDSIDSKG